MQLSVKQYDTLVKAINSAFSQYDTLIKAIDFVFSQKERFHDEYIELLHKANDVLVEIYDKHLENNKKTAEYIAKRRIKDKNYARSKK